MPSGRRPKSSKNTRRSHGIWARSTTPICRSRRGSSPERRSRAGTSAFYRWAGAHSPTLAHFLPIGMMLATPVLQLEEVEKRFPPPYVVEDKYDGIRAQVHKAGDRVELYSRTFDRITNRYPELVPPLLAIPGTFVIDGEVLAFAEGRAVPFTDFQTRLGRKNVAEELRTKMPSTPRAFDILERDRRALLDAPFDERQRILRDLPIVPPVIFAERQRLELSGEELVATLN